MKTALTDTTLHITFEGDLLSTNVNTLRQELLAVIEQSAAAQSIVVDLTHTKLVDSMGVNLLVAIHQETQKRNLALSVINASANIKRLLTMLNLSVRLGLSK